MGTRGWLSGGLLSALKVATFPLYIGTDSRAGSGLALNRRGLRLEQSEKHKGE
jgi:hypothetical protein